MTTKRYSPENLLKELGINAPEDIDVEAIAEYCQATVIPQKLKGSAARILGIGDRAFITVDSESPRARQRFSAAHELGHWMLDRGKMANFICSEKNFINDWSVDNPERRANRFAARLLLPRFMFEPITKNQPVTFQSVRELCKQFQTSLTATAIRLVELGSFPAMIVCNNSKRLLWCIPGPDVPNIIRIKDTLGKHTNAFGLLRGENTAGPSETEASDWITHAQSHYYSIHEDSVKINKDLVLTLLWWKNEKQLLDLVCDDF